MVIAPYRFCRNFRRFIIDFPRTRTLGALVVFPVMVGILLTPIFVDPSQLITAIVIWVILLWIIYDSKEKHVLIFK